MKKIILLASAVLFSIAISAQTPANNAPKGKSETKKEVKQETKATTEHKCAENKGEHKCADKGKDHKGCAEKGKDQKGCCDKGKDQKGCADKGKDGKGCADKGKDGKGCADKGNDGKGCCDKGKDGKDCKGHEGKDGNCCKDGEHQGNAYGHHKDGKCGRDFGQERAKAAKNKVEKEQVVKEVAQEVDQKVANTKNRVTEARKAVETQYKTKKITKVQYEEKMKRIDLIEKDVQRIETERQATDKVIKSKVS